MKYLLGVVLVLASCTGTIEGKKLDVVLSNRTGEEIEVVAKAGWLEKRIDLSPGERWTGWIPLIMVSDEIKIEIRKK